LGGSICFAHGKDVDGLSSAALINMATKAEVILVDYNDWIDKLSGTNDVDQVYICDIGTNNATSKLFLEQIDRIKKFADIHYIDHHPMEPDIKNILINSKVDLFHSLDECASVLTYLKFIDMLPKRANILASYGAVTDYMDEKPQAKRIISLYDRQFILLESSILTHALLGGRDSKNLTGRILRDLSNLKFPHEIEGIFEIAQKGLMETSRLMNDVEKSGVKLGWIAHMEVEKGTGATVANLLNGTFNVPIGVAYRQVKNEGVYEISLRGSYDFNGNLGKIVSQVSEMIGGAGGGHKKAAGARIPDDKIKDFLDLIEFRLDSDSVPTRH
jgi:RecJ-like exonuclease